MKAIRFSLLLGISCVVSFSCETTTTPLVGQDQHPIIGLWNWVRSGSAGGWTTPPAGYTKNIQFTTDSILYQFVNDTLISQEEYRLRRGKIYWIPDSVDIISLISFRGYWYDAWAAQYPYEDTLILDELGPEAVERVYVQIK